MVLNKSLRSRVRDLADAPFNTQHFMLGKSPYHLGRIENRIDGSRKAGSNSCYRNAESKHHGQE